MENQEYSRGLNFLGAVALSMTDKIGRAIATKTGLNRTLAAALIQIGMNPGENMVHLRRMTGLTQPNTSRLVDALMRRGLVRRSFVPAGDPRSSALDLTHAGVRTMNAAIEERYKVLQTAFAALSPSERGMFETLLGKILPHVSDDEDDTHVICRLCDFAGCPQDMCPADHLYRADIPA